MLQNNCFGLCHVHSRLTCACEGVMTDDIDMFGHNRYDLTYNLQDIFTGVVCSVGTIVRQIHKNILFFLDIYVCHEIL